jgi:hypothetical protein
LTLKGSATIVRRIVIRQVVAVAIARRGSPRAL